MKPKIVLVPYPAQGHVTPMVNLASAMLSHGFSSVVVVPKFIHSRIVVGLGSNPDIMLMSVEDGLDNKVVHDFFDIETAMENVMPIHLERVLREVDEGGSIACVVADLLASYAIEVAKKMWLSDRRVLAGDVRRLPTGRSDTGDVTYWSYHRFRYSSNQGLSTKDLPWLIGAESSIKGRFRFWCRTLHRSATLSWLLVNSFPHEHSLTTDNHDDSDVGDRNLVYFPIGPLRKLCQTTSSSFWEEDGSCLEWLDLHKPGSVMYVSFGSWVSPIASAKINDLALTLRALRRPFLWALSTGWRGALPDGYTESVKNLGKVVTWAPQARVLQHESIGVFLTHCGWNSSVEAIQWGRRLLCYPIAGDQFANCKFVVEIWRVGVRVRGFGREEVEAALQKLDARGMKERLGKLRQRIASEKADSRARANLADFVRLLNHQTTQPQWF